jgi:hypothetical protein
MYDELLQKHIKLVQMVNSADSKSQHDLALSKLRGFREGLEVLGVNQLADCDNFYINQGVERDMCAGVFLDWRAAV